MDVSSETSGIMVLEKKSSGKEKRSDRLDRNGGGTFLRLNGKARLSPAARSETIEDDRRQRQGGENHARATASEDFVREATQILNITRSTKSGNRPSRRNVYPAQPDKNRTFLRELGAKS